MGPELRNIVEQQLIEDLKNYGINQKELHFDWSESCIEGHRTRHLDGSVENFSGISVYDDRVNLVAHGWMNFIHEKDFFLAYWEFVTTWNKDKQLADKKDPGIHDHIWKRIPDDIKPGLLSEELKESPWK